MKCGSIADAQEWSRLQEQITTLSIDPEPLLSISRLGRLFPDHANPQREIQRRDAAISLINTFPQDECHTHPHVYELADEFYLEGGSAWESALSYHAGELSVLRNAACYYFRRSPVQCESVLRQGKAADASCPWWNDRLQKLAEFHRAD